VGLAIRFDDQTEGTAFAPPRVSGHTAQVLQAWLGRAAAQTRQLRAQRII
jgi:crotonobetainyl-CoA:carnitine CoA-transferase CaiB-like acyl-CoA transferase